MDCVFEPLSVRRGIREPIPLSEELPKRIWKYLDKWLTLADEQYTIRWQRYIMAAQYDEDSSFQRPDDLENIKLRARSLGSDEYLDVLDFALHELPSHSGSPNHFAEILEKEILAPTNINWAVSMDSPHRLMHRVRPETLHIAQTTLDAVPDHTYELLREAWAAAYGRRPDAKGPGHAHVKLSKTCSSRSCARTTLGRHYLYAVVIYTQVRQNGPAHSHFSPARTPIKR